MKRFVALFLAAVLILSVGTFSFAATGDGTYSDVVPGSWYANAVAYTKDNGIMSGTSDTAFEPDGTMTRAMLAAVLYRAAGSPAVTGTDSFTDTVDGAWYADAIRWASEQEIISGYGNALFGTDDPVSREQIATILWRYEGSPSANNAQGSSQAFSDVGNISAYAADAVNWSRYAGIINGKSGNIFDPKTSATRAEVAVILHNYLSGTSGNTPSDTPADQRRILIAYFSMPETSDPNNMTEEEANSTVVIDGQVLGNTQYVAYVIEEHTGGDIFRIEPETPYPLDHDTLVDQAQEEQNQNYRPALKGQIENIADYDTIFLGYPNWWGDMPMILYSFLEEYDLSGKTIVPFNTHGGSGFSSTISTITRLQPNANVIQNGFTVSRNNVQEARPDIIDWLDGLQLAAHL